jgi:hypothetical protein
MASTSTKAGSIQTTSAMCKARLHGLLVTLNVGEQFASLPL